MSAHSKHTLGRYELIREVARSNDIVYEAWDAVTQRRVAVKVLNIPSSASDAQKSDRKQRFEREARAAARLHHSNIVTLFDYGTEEDQDFLVFEFVEGPTLADKLLQDGPFPSDLAIEYSAQLLSALGYAHTQGVVHRDIKPSNIFVCEGNWLKISDLGIARIESETSVTTDGQIFGTPAYMAPEQVRGLDIDRRVDVWAAGVVLYQMVTGTQPFKGGSVLEIGSSVLNQEPDLELIADPKIRQVVAKALEKDRSKRFQTALEMLLGFKQPVAAPVPAPVSSVAPAPDPPPASPRRGGRTALIWVATCVAAAAFGAGLVSFGNRHNPVQASNTPKYIPPEVDVRKSLQDVLEEAWEHNSLHELAGSSEYRILPVGARADKLDTWCRQTIGKDYLALGQDDRERLVSELQDEFQAEEKLADLNPSQMPLSQNQNSARPLQQAASETIPRVAPITGQSAAAITSSQSVPSNRPAESPTPAETASPDNPAPALSGTQAGVAGAKVADAAPGPGSPGYTYPDQRSHDLDDLEVLRKLNFTPDGPPTIEKGGARLYKGANGTVRIR